jgi:hypothetical protein
MYNILSTKFRDSLKENNFRRPFQELYITYLRRDIKSVSELYGQNLYKSSFFWSGRVTLYVTKLRNRSLNSSLDMSESIVEIINLTSSIPEARIS